MTTIPKPWRLPEKDERREAIALLDEQHLPRTPANYSRAVRAVRLAAEGVRLGDKNDGSQN